MPYMEEIVNLLLEMDSPDIKEQQFIKPNFENFQDVPIEAEINPKPEIQIIEFDYKACEDLQKLLDMSSEVPETSSDKSVLEIFGEPVPEPSYNPTFETPDKSILEPSSEAVNLNMILPKPKCKPRKPKHRKCKFCKTEFEHIWDLQTHYPTCNVYLDESKIFDESSTKNTKTKTKISLSSKKSFICSCGRLFLYASSKKYHERKHQNWKPYRCKWANCTYTGIDLTTVKHHIRRHHFRVPVNRSEQIVSSEFDPVNPSIYIERILSTTVPAPTLKEK